MMKRILSIIGFGIVWISILYMSMMFFSAFLYGQYIINDSRRWMLLIESMALFYGFLYLTLIVKKLRMRK